MLKGRGGVFYASMVTYNHGLYRSYKDVLPDEEGMTRILKSGAADKPLYVHIMKDKEDMRNTFSCFKEIAILRTVEEMESEDESLHYIGIKQ